MDLGRTTHRTCWTPAGFPPSCRPVRIAESCPCTAWPTPRSGRVSTRSMGVWGVRRRDVAGLPACGFLDGCPRVGDRYTGRVVQPGDPVVSHLVVLGFDLGFRSKELAATPRLGEIWANRGFCSEHRGERLRRKVRAGSPRNSSRPPSRIPRALNPNPSLSRCCVI